MNSIQITGGPCQRGQEFKLDAPSYSIFLEDGRINLVQGWSSGDVLLVRRGAAYVFCGNSSPHATLIRDPSSQRCLAHGDELRLGPFWLRFETDSASELVLPRAAGFDWFRAVLCSFGVALLLLIFFLVGEMPGGSGDSGEGSGMSDGGEGVGTGSGSGFGDGEGPGRGAGESGDGSGSGGGTSGTGLAAAETASPQAVSPSESREPATPGWASPGSAPSEPARTEPVSAAPPPPVEKKMAILSPGAAPSGAAVTVSPGALVGERGGGGQVLGSGDVQITLRWDMAPDVDLHVTDPNGEEIWFDHIHSRSGGTLDVDDTEFEGPENIFWPTAGAPRGNYTVYVVLFEGVRANWWVRTRIDGVEKIHRGTLVGNGQRERVVSFSR